MWINGFNSNPKQLLYERLTRFVWPTINYTQLDFFKYKYI